MKETKSYLFKFFSICFGGLLFSCGLTGNGDEQLIEQRMQNFLASNIDRTFVLKDLEHSYNYQVNKHYYTGTFYAEDDPRVFIVLSVNEDDNYTQIIDAERKITYYNRLNRSIVISDQVEVIVNKYFAPDYVSTYVWTEAENFTIEIYKKDHLTPEIISRFTTKMKDITRDIEHTIQELDRHYYRVELNIFEDDYTLSKTRYNHTATNQNHPTGDYFVRAEIGTNNQIELAARTGFGSNLDNKFKTAIANKYGMQSKDVSRDFQVNKDKHPEDLDKNGVRHYMRYFVAIYDDAGREVIRRDFYKVNIFTHEITSYQPKK